MKSRLERMQAGKRLRQTLPRAAHRDWCPAADRPDAIALLEHSNHQRIPDLIPLRYGRMMQSPFAFLRGSALIMATDLATTPTTGIRVQACGDCHVMNFGGFATPERNLIFDLNDFDETLPAPWEWDVKRLAVSVMVAGREIQFSDKACYKAVLSGVAAYRLALQEYGQMHHLSVWYARLDADQLVRYAPNMETEQYWAQLAAKAFSNTLEQAFRQMTEQVKGQWRFVDHPPELTHLPNREEYFAEMQAVFEQYRTTLQGDRQFLLDRYRLVDVALKVVGVGSVGTHCGIALLMAEDNDPLLLQYKEARPSVLEPYAGKSHYASQGERIVSGQRLMQAASDMFLGWTNHPRGHDFYFRQFRDMKTAVKLKGMSVQGAIAYAKICAAALARAHARTGDPALISGYLGKSDAFDRAIADFAVTYAQQVIQDHQTLVEAVKSGRVEATLKSP